MQAFLEPFEQIEQMQSLRHGLEEGGFYGLTGAIDAARAQIYEAFGKEVQVRLILVKEEKDAKRRMEELAVFGEKVLYYPAKDLLFYQSDIRSNVLTRQRMQVLEALRQTEPVTIVATWAALMNQLPMPGSYERSTLFAEEGEPLSLEQWQKALLGMGYERSYKVEHPGEFAVRGGILDLFPLTEDNPIRIELWGDEIDTMRYFDAQSQVSFADQTPLRQLRVLPSTEIVLTPQEIAKGVLAIQEDSQKRIDFLRASFLTEEAARLSEATQEILEQLEQGMGSQALESHLCYFVEKRASLLDYLPKESLILLEEGNQLLERGELLFLEFTESMQRRLEAGYLLPGQMHMLFDNTALMEKLHKRRGICISLLPHQMKGLDLRESYHIGIAQGNVYHSSYELLLKDLKKYKGKKKKVIYVGGSRTRNRRLAEDLLQENINAFYTEDWDHEIKPGECMLLRGDLLQGYEIPEADFILITERDVFGSAVRRKKSRKKRYEGESIASFQELKPGDYVVHENHGLGIYRGMEKIQVDHVMKDYIKIEYAKSGVLYILANQLDLLQKYAGADAKKPKLNSLGGQEWAKTKARVKMAVETVARDLVELYALRHQDKGFAFGADTVWQKEFEEAFPYEETQGQLNAIAAVKADMESKKIMDRLICGDVGFGKTEIALRAAFKAVQEGKQVAYLAPTTILAQQHYDTFVERMSAYPVKVGLLCRFRSKSQQEETIRELKAGQVDVVIGTHRILSKDVGFHDLGLLIIDEEQRFGVKHKEKIKQMKKDVDVLSLSATPIPRTLHMSLVGIRDMSILDEAPMERTPIQTFVFERNEEMIREAVRREMARGGQIYYVYNRVAKLEEMADRLQRLVPEARIAFAHGKMSQSRLENIMVDFIDGEIDLLVSTTIIEIGLDISNVNTIIIDDADNMGLSQLYQLRGRVGRSDRTAYAFFMYRRGKLLKEVAEKRLAAIKEFSDLGSGFKIAMRDLEIRGAGNVLGETQSGHMEAVGYDLYCKMLGEAVQEEKGEVTHAHFDTSVDLALDAYLPERYVPDARQRMELYKRIADIKSEEEHDAMLEELIDRFGEPSRAVQNLLWIALFKLEAHAAWVEEIKQKGRQVTIRLYEKARINPDRLPELIARYQPYLSFQADPKTPSLFLDYGKNRKVEEREIPIKTREFIQDFCQSAVEEKA